MSEILIMCILWFALRRDFIACHLTQTIIQTVFCKNKVHVSDRQTKLLSGNSMLQSIFLAFRMYIASHLSETALHFKDVTFNWYYIQLEKGAIGIWKSKTDQQGWGMHLCLTVPMCLPLPYLGLVSAGPVSLTFYSCCLVLAHQIPSYQNFVVLSTCVGSLTKRIQRIFWERVFG